MSLQEECINSCGYITGTKDLSIKPLWWIVIKEIFTEIPIFFSIPGTNSVAELLIITALLPLPEENEYINILASEVKYLDKYYEVVRYKEIKNYRGPWYLYELQLALKDE